jgi:PKD repeat protein
MGFAARAAGAVLTAGAAGTTAMALLGNPGARAAGPPPTILYLEAAPRSADEGDFVALVASAVDQDSAALTYEWDLGDGSSLRRGTDLDSVWHRYLDDRLLAYTVRLRVTSPDGGVAEKSVKVNVSNLAPEIQVIERDMPVKAGDRVTFRASAWDPGINDQLTWQWDFGDGATGQGSPVTHTYSKDGQYLVAVTVEDGDGGRDRSTLMVNVGEVGSYQVTGEVALPTTEVDGASVMGMGRGSPAACHLAIGLVTEDRYPSFSLSAILPAGLGQRRYAVGQSGPGMPAPWQKETVQPGVFFAALQVPPAHATVNGRLRSRWFGSVSGSVDVDYFDGRYLELSFSITLQENGVFEDPPPRTVTVQGSMARRVGTTIAAGGYVVGTTTNLPAFVVCDRARETFDIAERTPEPNQPNVDWQQPEFQVAFTKPIDPGSLGPNVRLEHRLADQSGTPAFRTAAGSWRRMAADDHRIEFVPQAPLLDGVIYCLRIRSGDRGIRAVDGEVLDYASPGFDWRTERACQGGDNWNAEAVEWAFYTTPELESVRAAVYQVHRNVALVPGKPTLTRVFWDWHPRQGIHLEAQVDSFPADITVDAGRKAIYPPRLRTRILRSDRFSTEDTIFALNGQNFFGWKPGGGHSSRIRATIKPSGQRKNPPRSFTGETPNAIAHWGRSPVLTFDYYFLRVGEWSDSIPADVQAWGHKLMEKGRVFTAQNFPVARVLSYYRGHLAIHRPPGPIGTRDVDRDGSMVPSFYYPAGHWSLARLPWALPAQQALVDQAAAWDLLEVTDPAAVDVVVGIVPRSFQNGLRGMMHSFQNRHYSLGGPHRRVILLYLGQDNLDGANVATVAHEFGHFYGLCHTNSVPSWPNDCVQDRLIPQGFRIAETGRTGWNKDGVNQEADILNYEPPDPLMLSGGAGTRYADFQFITLQHYQHLMRYMDRHDVTRADPIASPPMVFAGVFGAGIGALQAPPAPNQVLEVSGIMAPDGSDARIGRIRLAIGSSVPDSGSHTVSLLDAAGNKLAATGFTPVAATSAETPADPDDSRYFLARLPYSAGGSRIQVSRGTTMLDERIRTPAPPSVRFEQLPDGSALTGPTTIRWSGRDPDGDSLTYTLSYSPNDSTWFPLLDGRATAQYAIDAADLEPGPSPTLRIAASDGFNTAEATARIRLNTSLRILAVTPAEGDSVFPEEAITAVVHADLDPATIADDWFVLTDATGIRVPADLEVESGGRVLVLRPLAPLRPGAKYSATLSAALADRWGRRLGREVTWSYSTRPAP